MSLGSDSLCGWRGSRVLTMATPGQKIAFRLFASIYDVVGTALCKVADSNVPHRAAEGIKRSLHSTWRVGYLLRKQARELRAASR